MVSENEFKRLAEAKQPADAIVTIVGSVWAASVALIGVLSDVGKLGWAMIVLGSVCALFWFLTHFEFFGTRETELARDYRVPRFSPIVPRMVGSVGSFLFVVGVLVLAHHLREDRIPADVFVYEPVVHSKDKAFSISEVHLISLKNGGVVHGIYESREDKVAEYPIEFVAGKRPRHKWGTVDQIYAVVDDIQPIPNESGAYYSSNTTQVLEELITYRLTISPPVEISHHFPAELVSDSNKKRVRLVDNMPCNFRLSVRFSNAGFYTLSVYMVLVTPEGKETLPVVERRKILVFRAPEKSLPLPPPPPQVMPIPEAKATPMPPKN